jgi:hypothetical protein
VIVDPAQDIGEPDLRVGVVELGRFDELNTPSSSSPEAHFALKRGVI